MIIDLDEKTIDNYLTTNNLVLIEYGASWCGPCKMTIPNLKKLSETQDIVKVATIDIDTSPQLAKRDSVTAVPTMILFENGIEVKRKTGAMTLPLLESFIK